jgi:hypothetical protein
MQFRVFWDVGPCCLVGVEPRQYAPLERRYAPRLQGATCQQTAIFILRYVTSFRICRYDILELFRIAIRNVLSETVVRLLNSV